MHLHSSHYAAAVALISGAYVLVPNAAGRAQEQSQEPQPAQQDQQSQEAEEGEQPQQAPAGAADVSEQDRSFMEKAAQGNMLEIQLGKMAQGKAGSQDVRQFGEQMVQDHSQAAEQFKQIAQQIGETPPQSLPDRQQNLISAMADLEPDRFDPQYMWNMVAAHTVAVNVFEQQIEEGSNPMLVQFAEKVLAKLQQHRDKAVSIWNEMG